MANNDKQNESALPIPGGNNKISASDFLPRFFRTQANKKFLQATLDQLIQPGVAEKLSGYYGRKTAKAYRPSDNYIEDVTESRQAYQLEPATVIKDAYNNVNFYKDYNDYIGQLGVFGANTDNHSRLNSQESYPWNPNIDWDKFVNFREYYWLPNGPVSIPVRGQAREVTSTYTVTIEDQGDNFAYVFNDGLTRNPTLKLYRGQTYRFEIDTPGHPIAFAITRSFTPGSAIITAGTEGIRGEGLFDAILYGNEYDQGEYIVLPSGGSVTFEEDENVSTLYPDGIRKLGEEGEEVAVAYIEKGTIEFTIPINAPDRLYYISKNAVDTSGLIKIYDIEENAFLDVENEIIGKKYYTSANGVELSNGMKIRFQGDVSPSYYDENQWYVEGVGEKITLINEKDLIIPSTYSDNKLIPFDTDEFDTLPFADASAYATQKDYIVINRASPDKNAWSRYNCWHHKDVVLKSFEFNNLPENLDQSARAKRPIIEFEAGLKLNNFGSYAKSDVDLIDTFTIDVFSNIEGQLGYNIDGIDLADGMRILFTADPDILVNGKIFQVKFIEIGNNRQITLVETDDSEPQDLETILVTQGVKNSGKSYHYHGGTWLSAQEKTTTNQQPLFEVCDINGNSFADNTYYESTTFKGTKIFSYEVGEGTNDDELGFPLTYRNIDNSGDILFNFNLLSDTFTYQTNDDVLVQQIKSGYIKKYKTLTDYKYVNGFSSTPLQTKQYVIREYVATSTKLNNFEIDVYKKSSSLNDLKVVVFVNNKIKLLTTDYILLKTAENVVVEFVNDLEINDVVKIKTNSKAIKNEKGYYEFPYNLERNPLNDDIAQFTLGEVIDHVDSMLEDLPNFKGSYLGDSNLRDLGDLDRYGKRFVKHSGPINLPLYHVTNKKYNIVKALKYSKKEYSRFKRVFIENATNLGFDGPVKKHVDKVLSTINIDKLKTEPFYFSDMVPYGPANRIEYIVLDSRITDYPLTDNFNLNSLTEKGTLVYLNGKQLTFEKDYNFNVPGYVSISAGQVEEDIIEIYEYSSSDGSFIPPTPSKLGLYPKYYPELTIDDTLVGDKPTLSGPFKVYGEIETGSKLGQRGWTYPLYTSKSAAAQADAENGGQRETSTVTFKGLNKLFFIPVTNATSAGSDNAEIDEYPNAVAFIRGHDGSFIKAYKDYRDELLIELEKRIFNNIKINYSADRLDIQDFLGGEYRSSEFTKNEIDNTLLVDFQQWLLNNLNNNSYTNNYFYDRNNNWTFNYADTTSPNGNINPGFWRGLYQHAYDTDRPHSHPWEMLGFSRKPSWWNDVYGPAPYTGDNLVLWRDLEAGRISEPGNIRINPKYVREGLTNSIPVDTKGNLVSPLNSGYANNFLLKNSTRNFKFGDWSPVENAWRRSPEYPFAVITSFLLNKPAKVMGLGFDLSRVQKNLANQWAYTETNQPIVLKEIKLPNTYESENRTLTSGLVNYIYNLVSSNILTVYDDYKTDLESITNQIGIKLAGFTSKEKFNLILDSRSPTQNLTQDGIFVPQENYQVFLNTSSPADLAIYSGVIIEKQDLGYVVRGYSLEKPYFEYYAPRTGSSYNVVTVGGISERTQPWDTNTDYISGEVIYHNSIYYRVIDSYTSSNEFDASNLAKLPGAPLTGGRTAEFKKNFNNLEIKKLQYGTRLSTAQEVIDFLLGYSKRQEDIGFAFDAFDAEGNVVENWYQSAKEFLYWTTQGWASGALIALSPGANLLEFDRDYYVVDNIKDDFYGYSIFKADGLFLDAEFNSLLRTENSFGIEVKGTDEGLYHASLPLVQKEHVVLIDNKTVFNDLIYNPSTGYRQERIKVNGYRSDNWNGGLNIPGFVFDDARYTDWAKWKDYTIGDLIKYKQYYYVAAYNVPGSDTFNSNFWYRLSDKPESKLITNFDYRINQFNDFYDLDSDSFDTEQQRIAQHLIGYQKRQYLANIINDDVSQFKFYRGAIADKGTKKVFSKLFDALDNTTDSLDFYEEWAIRVGRFGAVDDVQQVEYLLDDSKMQESPQAFELLDKLPSTNFDKIYRILPSEVYDKPDNYTHAPFPTKSLEKEYIPTGGYVNEDDVDFIIGRVEGLTGVNVNDIGLGETIWVSDDKAESWSVLQLIRAGLSATELTTTVTEFAEDGSTLVEITTDKWTNNFLSKGDLIGIKSADQYGVNGIYEIYSLNLDKIKIKVPTNNDIQDFIEEKFTIVTVRVIRFSDIASVNEDINQDIYNDQKLWIDNYDGDWAVLENNSVYSNLQTIENPNEYDNTNQGFGKSVAITSDNNNVFVSTADAGNGTVAVYRRTRESSNLVLNEELNLDDTSLFDPSDSDFGKSIDVSSDGEYLAIGIPKASNIKTRLAYKTNAETGLSTFDFQPDATYVKNDIVRYRESLWKANREILPEIANQPFSTFDTYINLASQADADSTNLNLLVAGDPGLENNTVDHLLVRAPKDMYIGTAAGDTINLFWNRRSYAYPTLDNYFPFDGDIPQITDAWITNNHTIVEKIDHIFYVNTFITLPQVGDRVTTDTGSAEVFYVSTRRDSAVMYLKDTNGVFNITDTLYVNDEDLVGVYTEESTYATTDAVAGYWYIETGFSYSNNGRYYDVGRGLVYADVRLQSSTRDINDYYNVQDTVGTIGTYIYKKNQVSFLNHLSYQGDPSPSDGTDGVDLPRLSDLWVARVGTDFSNKLTAGETYNFRLYNLDNRIVDVATKGFDYNHLNQNHTIIDLWDGYIDFELSEFDFQGFAFQPQVGDIIEDVQTPRDGQGGLALTSRTTSSAEIVFLQRNFNNVRVYVKLISGDFGELSNIGRYEIRRKANINLRGTADVDRVVGVVDDIDNQVVVGTSLIGKLLVFRNQETNFPIVSDPEIVDEEYWFFNETVEAGISRVANPPYSLNKDYTQVYNITASEFGAEASYANEGAVALYRRLTNGNYRLQNVFVSEYRVANREFGNVVKLVQDKNYYTLLVGSKGLDIESETDSTGRRTYPGSIEVFRHGTRPTDSFKGEYKISSYSKGDIVLYKDAYYVALKDVTADENQILNPLYWNNISWRYGKDIDFRGEFDNSYTYKEGSIVSYNNVLWKSVTNVSVGAAVPSLTNTSWAELDTRIDYLGYLPNLTATQFYNEDVFDPAENILEFSNSFDISADAQVLVVTSKQQEADSTVNTKVVIYREIDNKYAVDQIITAPNNTDNWADTVSINPAGTHIAISSPLADDFKTDQGKVDIYTMVDGQFALTQTLQSPNNEVSEKFGYNINFGKDNLVVSSLNGDQKIPTTFDSSLDEPTTFDNNFTEFKNTKYDKGVVYVYENVNGTLLYSEQFNYAATQIQFGETLYTSNNHVYVGIPQQFVDNDTNKGILIDYRKPNNSFAWGVLKQGITPVDVSKIRGAFLYNKRTNQIVSYIDYIDPVQGKIAGPAAQEISFKTEYDPAIYNTGPTADVLVDPARSWTDNYVGKVWWDLTNAKFVYPYQGTTSFQKNNWNKLTPDSTIDVYEWVESDYIPSAWDQLSDTPDGYKRGVSGTTLYGDTRYSTKITYDDISKTFGRKYYFWVQNKRTIPTLESRRLNIIEIANLIANPLTQKYKFLSLLSNNKFVLNNCENIVQNQDIVLNIKYSTGPKENQNLHSQYKLISDGKADSLPDPEIELKWFDSLIGSDTNGKEVPNPSIPLKNRYGIQNRPRQSMFVNRFEALKQVIERINIVLKQNLIVDEYDISKLEQLDEAPTQTSKHWDLNIDTVSDLQYVSTSKIRPAKLSPVITNGRIVRVNIDDSGRGYKVPSSYKINGEGVNAEFDITINNLGQITNVTVLDDGKGYNESTTITVRPFTVLVSADEEIQNKWALYSWNSSASEWYRRALQGYNTTLYWDFVDWYADGYNQFTSVSETIDGSYQLSSLDITVGDIVKINNVGSGGWLLLRKIDDQDTEDYTVNFETIGRQSGTIQFNDKLYNYSTNTVGFDNINFDNTFYDNNPSTELRIILEAIRNDIFVGTLAIEYNQLFMASLRYVMAEQPAVDWMFKTSFVTAKHNRETLNQKDITFNNDNLASYQDFVEEFKPYKTTIREFVSNYDILDNTNSSISDFDLPPAYNKLTGVIEASKARIIDNVIVEENLDTESYPRKHWKDSVGYQIKEVLIGDSGSGYTFEPIVKIVGGGGHGATAKAYLGYGKITAIKITNPGSGYTSTPTVVIEGSQTDDGTLAKATAILGNGLVRSPSVKIKFDRTSGTYIFEDLAETEYFTGTNSENRFYLQWPMDLDLKKVKVYIDNVLQLRSAYTFTNIKNFDKSYVREQGKILFTTPPALNAEIRVEYYKPISMLSAEDRIKFAYNPLAGMYGKDLAQLMTGVDYGGVEVQSFEFGGSSGWDSQPWYTDNWDAYLDTFEDEVFVADGSTIAVQLNTPLKDGILYTLYKNGIRIDDPNFDAGTPTNDNAIVNSITGDGITDVIYVQDLGISIDDGDVFVVRKATSDGSIQFDPTTYDTQLIGGDLVYSTAAGINAEEIIVDGDGFVTPTTSGGPEELVPGQILDTLDIKVYTRESGGQGIIYSQSYRMTSELTYDLGVIPGSMPSIFVKVSDIILPNSEYTVDWTLNTITLNSATVGAELNILAVAQGGQNILDFGQLTADGISEEYIIPIKWIEGMSVYANVNGVQKPISVFNSENDAQHATIRFEEIIDANDIINYTAFGNSDQINYSQITKDVFTGDGIETEFTLSNTPFYSIPTEQNIMVKVDNEILKSGYNIEYTIPENNQREFALETFQKPSGSLAVEDVKVFVNGVEIVTPVQWRFEIANSSIILADDVGVPGDLIEIFVITDGDYRVDGKVITFDNAPANNSTVEIFQFSNHNIIDIERINYDVISRITMYADDINYITYNRLTVGEISLRKPAEDAQYVWVSVNGELLTPSVDYYVTDDRNKVRLIRQPVTGDVIDIIHFTASINVPKFSFRQFKDMLNRTHYKRLEAAATTLAYPLNYYDLRIEVEDGSTLSEPNKAQNLPGVVFIDGERIEYFIKEENTLRQIRRGTLGTGVKTLHEAGTKVYDQNISKTMPYQDQTLVDDIEADGSSNVYEINYAVGSVNEIEVFVAGTRLRKAAIDVFDATVALDSPEGDSIIDAEFTFDSNTNSLVLRDVPNAGSQIKIIKKIGKSWTQEGITLGETDNSIGRFLRAGTSELPE